VAAPDVSGIGEVGDNNYGTNYLAYLIGRSIPGIQAADVNRVANFLQTRPDIDQKNISAVAFDEMGPALLHAAAFSNTINNVTLIGSLVSYQNITNNKFYNRDLTNSFVAGSLKAYDLPDLAGCIAPGKLKLINLKDGQGNSINSTENDDVEFIKAAWKAKDAGMQLQFITENSEDKLLEYLFK
jgi:hypothetical protein